MAATVTSEPQSAVRVWNLSGAEAELEFAFESPDVITAVTFSPVTVAHLAIGAVSQDAFIVDPVTNQVARRFPDTPAAKVAFSHDGRLLVVGADNKTKVFDVP
jgi:WD40 repeat protein